MSGLVGSIKSESKEFDDIGINSTVEGIKMANYLNGRVATAENEQKQQKDERRQKNSLVSSNIVEDIRQDMKDSRDR